MAYAELLLELFEETFGSKIKRAMTSPATKDFGYALGSRMIVHHEFPPDMDAQNGNFLRKAFVPITAVERNKAQKDAEGNNKVSVARRMTNDVIAGGIVGGVRGVISNVKNKIPFKSDRALANIANGIIRGSTYGALDSLYHAPASVGHDYISAMTKDLGLDTHLQHKFQSTNEPVKKKVT